VRVLLQDILSKNDWNRTHGENKSVLIKPKNPKKFQKKPQKNGTYFLLAARVLLQDILSKND